MSARPFLEPGQTPPAEPPRFPSKPPPGRPPRRRGLLGAVAALAVAPAVEATVAPPAPDHALLAACAKARRIGGELDRLKAMELAADSSGDKAAENAAFNAAVAIMPSFHAALAEVWELPAHTAEGRRARAHVALMRIVLGDDGLPDLEADMPLFALCQDVLAGGGA